MKTNQKFKLLILITLCIAGGNAATSGFAWYWSPTWVQTGFYSLDSTNITTTLPQCYDITSGSGTTVTTITIPFTETMEGTPKVAVSLTDFYFPADTRTGQPYNDIKQVGLKATNPSTTGFDVLVTCELSASLTKLKFNWFATTRTNVGLVYFEKLAVDLDATWTTDTVTDVLTFDVPLDHLTLSNLYRKSVMISGFKMDYPAADASNQAYLAVQFEAKNTTSLTTVTLDLSKDTTTQLYDIMGYVIGYEADPIVFGEMQTVTADLSDGGANCMFADYQTFLFDSYTNSTQGFPFIFGYSGFVLRQTIGSKESTEITTVFVPKKTQYEVQIYQDSNSEMCWVQPTYSILKDVKCTNANFYYYSGICIQSCPEGTYRNANNQCIPCATNCLTCTSGLISGCSACKSGYYFQDVNAAKFACVSTCNDGYFADPLTLATVAYCTACPTNCKTCARNSSDVIECTLCNATWYINSSDKTACEACTAAKTYVSGSYCQHCPNYVDSSTCVASCPERKYADANGYCQNCASGCLTCTGAAISTCSECADGQFLQYTEVFGIDGITITSETVSACVVFNACGSNKFADTVNPIYRCTRCGPNCETCSRVSGNIVCSACSTGSYYFNTVSVSGCESCTANGVYISGSNCIHCSSPTAYVNQARNACIESCPAEQYGDTDYRCQSCAANCNTCSGPAYSNCTKCNKGATDYYLKYGTGANSATVTGCVTLSNCGTGFWGDSSQDPYFCDNCGTNCDTCTDSGATCTACSTNTINWQDDISSCTACDTASLYTHTCTVGDTDKDCCYTCSSPSQYVKATLSDPPASPYQCVSDCGDEFYVGDLNYCTRCADYCKTCSSSSDYSDCSECIADYYLVYSTVPFVGPVRRNLIGLTIDVVTDCVATCATGYFQDALPPSGNPRCTACGAGCDDCHRNTDIYCDTCAAATPYINNDQQDSCEACGGDREYYSTGTIDSVSKTNGVCFHCDSYVQSNTCVSDCGDQFFSGARYYCESCASKCKTCSGSAITDCSECLDTYYFKYVDDVQDSCVTASNCPTGTFADEVGTDTCTSCGITDCDTCDRNVSGTIICSQCGNSKFVYTDSVGATTCVTCDYDGVYISGDTCLDCGTGCKQCKDSSNCVACTDATELVSANSQGECVACTGASKYTESCKLADNTLINSCCFECTAGKGGIYVNDTGSHSSDFQYCAASCTSDGGWTNSDNYCQSCASYCQTCSSSEYSGCSECDSTYYLVYGPDASLVNRRNLQNNNQLRTLIAAAEVVTSCTQSCATGYFEDDNPTSGNPRCTACGTNCDDCHRNADIFCDICTAGTSYINNDSQDSCEACDGDKEYHATGTIDGVSVSNGVCFHCTNYVKDSTCVETCGDEFFIGTNSYCTGCASGCKTCTSSAITDCSECVSGKYFKYNGATKDSCVDSSGCPSGTFADEEGTDTCTSCGITNCTTCDRNASGTIICSKCSTGNYVYTDSTGATTCVDCTAAGVYISGDTCLDCGTGCSSCIDSSNCKTCTVGTQYVDGSSQGNCVACSGVSKYSASCTLSDSSTVTCCYECSDAHTGAYVNVSPPHNSDYQYCAASCPTDGGWTDTNKYCQPCADNCQTCSSGEYSGCSECDSTYYLVYGPDASLVNRRTLQKQIQLRNLIAVPEVVTGCTQSCDTGYFEDDNPPSGNPRCTACGANCDDCHRNTVIFCDTCTAGTSYINNDSQDSCEACDGDKEYSATGTIDGVSKSNGVCFHCPNYVLDSGCVDSCGTGQYYDSRHYCQSCASGCATCTGSAITDCTECDSDQYFVFVNNAQSSCVTAANCPTQTFADTYPTYNQCTACGITDCDSCERLIDNSIKCQQCSTDKYMPTSRTSCGTCDVNDGKYIDGVYCQSCYSDDDWSFCKTCTTSSTNDCTSCYDDWKFQNPLSTDYLSDWQTYCVPCTEDFPTASGEGFYNQSGEKVCQLCSDLEANCKTCTDTDCTVCQDQFYLVDADKSCASCISKCKTCTEATHTTTCDQCVANYYLVNGDVDECVNTCDTTDFHWKSTTPIWTCGSCPSNCKVCPNGSSCTTCDTANGYFFSSANDGTCVRCPPGQQGVSGSCQSCGSTQYADTNESGWNICQNCTDNCTTCSQVGSDVVCSACAVNYQGQNRPNGTCVTCGVGTFLRTDPLDANLDECQACIDGCDECNNTTSCITCNADYFTLYSTNTATYDKTCVLEADCDTTGGYWQNSVPQTCGHCATNCLECTGDINTDPTCSKCDEANLWYLTSDTNDTCMRCNLKEGVSPVCTSCGAQQYPQLKTQTLAEGDVNWYDCTACPDNCVTCNQVNGSPICSVCDENYWGKTTGKCTECLVTAGYRMVQNSNGTDQCDECGANCDQCTDFTHCTQCKATFKRQLTTDGDFCVSVCPDFYYAFTTTDTPAEDQCLVCADNCIECSDGTVAGCTICDEDNGYFFTTAADTLGVARRLLVSEDQTCIYCPAGKGGFSHYCRDCNSSEYATTGAIGTKSDANICIPCTDIDSDCLECSINSDDVPVCDVCDTDYWGITTRFCLYCNPIQHFINYHQDGTDSCDTCDANGYCKYCSNSDYCNECYPDYYMFMGEFMVDGFNSLEIDECMETCPDNYYGDSDKVCQLCWDENCKTCTDGDIEHCDVCFPGYQLLSDVCVLEENCGQGQYANSDSVRCQDCTQNCSVCHGSKSDQCDDCMEGYCLDTDTLKCVAVGLNFEDSNHLCSPCDTEDNTNYCYKCSSMNVCTECTGGLYLFDSACVETCPPGYHKRTIDGKPICEICPDVYYEGDCVAECPIDTRTYDSNVCEYDCENPLLYQVDATHCFTVCPVEYRGKEDADGVRYCELCPVLDVDGSCFDCGPGRYQNTSGVDAVCSDCPDVNCNVCPQGVCSDCNTNYELVDGTCTCPSDYFFELPDEGVCSPCDDANCLTCTSCECLVCKPTHYLENGVCIEYCLDGTYADSNKVCQDCLPSCATCSDGVTCDSCKASFFLNSDDLCGAESECQIETYGETDTWTCEPCPLFIYHNRCRNTQPLRTWLDSDDQHCWDCDDVHCAECSETECFTCDETYFHQGINKCQLLCDIGYVQNHRTMNCDACQDNCDVCAVIPLKEGQTNEDNICKVCTLANSNDADNVNNFFLESRDDIYSDCINCPFNQFGNRDSHYCELCPSGQYKNPETGLCESCGIANCSICIAATETDPIICQICEESNGYFLVGTTNTCSGGVHEFMYGDYDTHTWEDCAFACIECSGPEVNQCITCYGPANDLPNCDGCELDKIYFKFGNNSACKECPIGQFGNLATGECEDCDPKCYSCSDKTTCTKCSGIRESTPDCDCPNNYFPHVYTPAGGKPIATCNKCYDTCQTCTHNDGTPLSCTSCKENRVPWTPETPFCACEAGLAEVLTRHGFLHTIECVPCSSRCRTCSATNPDECLSCNGDFILNPETASCLPGCPPRHFADWDLNECVPCHASCASCDGASDASCLSCDLPSLLKSGSCVNSCQSVASSPSDTYLNIFSSQCQTCSDPNCARCTSAGGARCLECQNGKKLSDGVCVTTCPPVGTFENEVGVCVRCHAACKACTGPTSTDCVSCTDDRLFNQNQNCVSACKKGYAANVTTKTCTKCANCDDCESLTRCVKCSPGFLLYQDPNNTSNFSCFRTCPPGSYQDRAVCVACKSLNKILYNGKCVDIAPCPPFHYTNRVTFECTPCAAACYSCTGILDTQCTSCQDSYYLLENRCFEFCPPGFYEDTKAGTCKACSDALCQECQNNQCSLCLEGAFLNVDGVCVEECPAGRYADIITKSCDLCHHTCATCFEKRADNCLTCATGSFLFNFKCVTACPQGFISNADTNNCDRCPEECESCTSTDGGIVCASCVHGLFYHQASCLNDCSTVPRTYADAETNSCNACMPWCLTCSGPGINECLSCPDTSYLNQGVCMPICPIGFFKNSSNNRCEPCDVSCAVCDTSATDCVLFGACANGYFLLEDKCVKDCPEGTTKRYNTYFDECLPNDQVYSHYLMPSTDSINSPCHASCKTCIDDSDTGCIECFSGLKLTVDGTCAEDCGYGFYFDSVLLVCKACSLQCNACENFADACTECAGDKQNPPECKCPPRKLNDNIKDPTSCVDCKEQCQSCTLFPHLCTECRGANRNTADLPRCSCLKGFYALEDDTGDCAACAFVCATCDNDTTCLTCKGDRAGEDCACPAGTYDDGASEFCVPCGTPGCSECSSPSGQCTACLGDRILTDAKECACADGKYDDGRSLNCVACDYKCATCSGSATSCLTCAGDRINQHCDCPAGKFDNGVVECVVPQCDITCASCDLNGCLTCAANRYGPLHYKCDCPEEDNGVSRLAPLNTPACSTCQHGVIDAYFSYDLSQILVDFGAQLALSDSKLEGTNALCKRVLNQAVIDQIGYNPTCGVSGNNFVIYLSEVATIINGNLIQFIDNSPPTINFNGCRYIDGTLRFVRTFSTAILKLPTKTPVIIPVATFAQALLTTPFPLFSLCTTVNLEIVNYKYTALRIPNNIRWTVDKMKKEDAALKAKLQAILDGQNSLQIAVSGDLLNELNDFTFKITYSNFVGTTSSSSVTISTLAYEAPDVSITTSEGFIFFPSNFITIEALVSHLSCGSGVKNRVASEVLVQWEYVSGSADISALVNQEETQSPLQNFSYLNIDQYQLQSNTQYKIRVTASLIGLNVPSVSRDYTIYVGVESIVPTIIGGDQMVNALKAKTFAAKYFDPNYPTTLPSGKFYTFSWKCTNSFYNRPCATTDGTAVESSSTLTYAIPAKTFQVYQSYTIQFTVTLQSGNAVESSSTDLINLTVTELVFGQHEIIVPDYLTKRRINLNEFLSMSLVVDTTAPVLYFSGVFNYKGKDQAVLTFEFEEFKFRIWDYINPEVFTPDTIQFRLTTSVYNPAIFMPTLVSVDFDINIPPVGCQLQIYNWVNNLKAELIVESDVVSADQELCITVVNCADDDKPLKYKYGYFVSKASFEEDVVQSLGGYNMQLLSDSSTFNEFVSNLMPGAFSNLLADYEPQIIMVSITDSLGGMTNLTRPLTVIPVTAARRRQLGIADEEFNLEDRSLSTVVDVSAAILQLKDFLNNPDTEVSKLSIFSLSYLQNYTVTMLPVVNYVIERLTYHLKNSPSLVWREQSLNIIGMLYNNELFIKQNDDIPTLDTMLTTIFNYVQSQVNEYQAKLNLSISTGDSGKKPKIDTLVNQLLKTLSTLSSIIKSTRRFLPTNDYIDIQRKYELANVNTLYKKILAVFAYMAPSIRTGMLPNEKARQYDDDMVYFSTELITEDKLKKMFAPPESNQYMVGSFQLSDQLLAENATTNTSVSYMNFAITQFQINLFAAEPEFKYPASTFPVYDVSITSATYETMKRKQRRILETTSNSSTTTIELQNLPPVSYYFPIEYKKASETHNISDPFAGYVCISKDAVTGQWNTDSCAQQDIFDQNGWPIGASCKCDKPSITTLVHDYLGLYHDISAAKVLSQSELSTWNTVLEPLFYTFMFLVLDFCILMYWGHEEDKKDSSFTPEQKKQRRMTRMLSKRMTMTGNQIMPFDLAGGSEKLHLKGIQDIEASSSPNQADCAPSQRNLMEERNEDQQLKNNGHHHEDTQNNFLSQQDEPINKPVTPQNREETGMRRQPKKVIDEKEFEQLASNEPQANNNEEEKDPDRIFLSARKPITLFSHRTEPNQADNYNLISARINQNFAELQSIKQIEESEAESRDSHSVDDSQDKVINAFGSQENSKDQDKSSSNNVVPHTELEKLLALENESYSAYFKVHHTFFSIFYVFMASNPRLTRFAEELIQIFIYLCLIVAFTTDKLGNDLLMILLCCVVTQMIVQVIVVGSVHSQIKWVRLLGVGIVATIIAVGLWFLNFMAYRLNNGEIRNRFPTFVLIVIADYFVVDPVQMLVLYYIEKFDSQIHKEI